MPIRRLRFFISNYPFIRFILIGILSYTLIVVLTIFFNNFLFLSSNISVLYALIISYLLNFILVKFFVFKKYGGIHKEAIKYALSSIFFRSLEYIFFVILFSFNINIFLSLTISLFMTTIIKYIFFKKIIFFKDRKLEL